MISISSLKIKVYAYIVWPIFHGYILQYELTIWKITMCNVLTIVILLSYFEIFISFFLFKIENILFLMLFMSLNNEFITILK